MKKMPLLSTTQLSAALHGARKGAGITQEELATRMGLSQSRVSYLEKNSGELSVAQLLDACAALGLELSIGLRGAPESTALPASTDW